ncbi:MAG: hypothetical protein ACKO96_34930, partial [Flammeovirgaceae bacterium]
RRRAIKNLRFLPRDKINETHRTFLTHTPPDFLQASVMASLQPSSEFNVDRAQANFVHREVSQASRPRKILVVRQKVSSIVVARELVVLLLQMFSRRVVNKQKCHQVKSLNKCGFDF